MLKKIINIGIILFSLSSISYAQYANIEELNNTASCDSTCSLDPEKVKVLSGQKQRISNCGYGYIGTNLEERILQEDGNWSEWREVNRDNCVCSPLIENQEVVCPENQRGQHIQTRDWTCPSAVQGVYTSWVTKSNTCAYYYLNTSTEEQTVACPDNQRGTHIQTRNYENWSDGNKKNYTEWTTKSNTCDYYLTAASQIELGSASCPSGYSGSINQQRTYDRWSDGNARNYGSWIEVSRNCTPIGSTYSYSHICAGTYNLYSVISGGYCVQESGVIGIFNESIINNGYLTTGNAVLTNPSFFSNLYTRFPPRVSCGDMGKSIDYISNHQNNKSTRINYYNGSRNPSNSYNTDPLGNLYPASKSHVQASPTTNIVFEYYDFPLLDSTQKIISPSSISGGVVNIYYTCY